MPVKIFFCYAHEDEPLLEKLKTHLKPLHRRGLIDVWYDRDIGAGAEWEREISRHLEEAEILLLLVSPDFIASDYCYGIEMKRAIQRHERGEVSVIPIILRPVDLHEVPFMKLQALPSGRKPVTSWSNIDEAYLDIISGIRKRVEERSSQQYHGMAPLDVEIQTVLSNWSNSKLLKEPGIHKASRRSIQDEGKTIIELLNDSKHPFFRKIPVFVSIGGGEVVNYLLRRTRAMYGILVEASQEFAENARVYQTALPKGKMLDVYEGKIQEKIDVAITHSLRLINSGAGDFIAVICHYTLHELFDKDKNSFDILHFFATIFQDDSVATWFTYTESGIPEQWTQTVLMEANCSSYALLLLIEKICSYHPVLHKLSPAPQIIGNHVRLHSALAMECISKLSHLPDLACEIETRSIAIEHSYLVNALWLAIGDTAKQGNRGNILASTSLTDSYRELCKKYDIQVKGLNDDNSLIQLPIAESLIRVVAWRLSPTFRRKASLDMLQKPNLSRSRTQGSVLAPDLLVTTEALSSHDDILLCAILASKARAWIESPNANDALQLLRAIRTQRPQTHFGHLWSHYNLSLASLFKGDPVSPEWFAPALEECAEKVGLGILFRAERMEFSRRVGNIDVALTIANTLISDLPLTEESPDDNVRRYAIATAYFLVASLLREGGLYQMAWQYINNAQTMYRQGIPSHDTELAHCYYAKAVCVAMTGISSFDTPFDSMNGSNDRQFATALITLSYSYAAWFMDEINRARQFALDSAKMFSSIEYTKYANRAHDLAFLLECWNRLDTSKSLPDVLPNTRLAKLVAILVGIDNDIDWLMQSFSTLRPSQALGLLQFAKRFRRHHIADLQILLPRTLMSDNSKQLRWHSHQSATSLEEADHILRQHLKIAPERRLPLLADAT
jgi:hypothetical protein